MNKKVERMLTLLLINSNMFQNSQNGSTLTSNPHTNIQTTSKDTERKKESEKNDKTINTSEKIKKKQNVMHFYFHTT